MLIWTRKSWQNFTSKHKCHRMRHKTNKEKMTYFECNCFYSSLVRANSIVQTRDKREYENERNNHKFRMKFQMIIKIRQGENDFEQQHRHANTQLKRRWKYSHFLVCFYFIFGDRKNEWFSTTLSWSLYLLNKEKTPKLVFNSTRFDVVCVCLAKWTMATNDGEISPFFLFLAHQP